LNFQNVKYVKYGDRRKFVKFVSPLFEIWDLEFPGQSRRNKSAAKKIKIIISDKID
jgi:hypothetical protein